MANIKRTGSNKVGKNVGKLEPSDIDGANVNGVVAMEYSWAVPEKVKHRVTSNATLRFPPKRNEKMYILKHL